MGNEKKIDTELNEEKVDETSNTEEDNESNNDDESNINNDNISESKEDNLVEKFEELNNRYLRLQADFINFKKRNEKEKDSLVTYAKSSIASDLLNVLDNFERAFVSVDESIVNSGFYKGIEMVYKQLTDILTKNGIEEIEALNKKFDPNYHYAVMQEESEEFEQNTIIEVLQKGYKINDKVIRPSMVKVTK